MVPHLLHLWGPLMVKQTPELAVKSTLVAIFTGGRPLLLIVCSIVIFKSFETLSLALGFCKVLLAQVIH